MANQFYVEPAQFGPGLSALAGSVNQFGEQQRAQQKAAEQEAYTQRARQAMAEAFQSGDPRAIRSAAIEYPEIAETVTQLSDFTNDQTKQVALETYRRAIPEPDPARKAAILEGGIETVSQLGGRPTMMTSDLQLLQEDPEAWERSAKAYYASLASDEEFEAMFPDESGGVTAPSNVREYEYYNSLSPEDQRRYLAMKRSGQTFRQGDVTMAVDPRTQTTAQPITEGGEVTTQEQEQARLTSQEAEKQASIKAAEQAITVSNDAFKRLEPVKTAIANYDEAIDLVERQGANTGVIASKFPSIQQASIKLDNLQGRLGLDVIGNTTFGALSEAELKFALNTALPKNLQGPELVKWLKKKKQTQEKLAGYLEEAAIYLGTPGNTVASFLEEKKEKSKAANQAPAPALDYLMQNPDQIDAFEEKYGYRPEGF